jgi:ABC-type dipeptide/oligopeptide/nickel transport system ATPase subunit
MNNLVQLKDVNLTLSKNHILKNVSFKINKGRKVGLIGESGSGKSTIARLIMKLYNANDGDILINDRKVESYKNKLEYYKMIQMIYQDPFSALDPTKKVKEILEEPLKIHNIENREEKIKEIMQSVGLPLSLSDRLPNQLSGGQCQRIGICRALLLNPELIILDESIASLDISVQALILNMLDEINQKTNTSMLFISHDLSIIEYFCDEIIILHDGYVVEYGDKESIFNSPQHPYTKKLLTAIPKISDEYHKKIPQLDGNYQHKGNNEYVKVNENHYYFDYIELD